MATIKSNSKKTVKVSITKEIDDLTHLCEDYLKNRDKGAKIPDRKIRRCVKDLLKKKTEGNKSQIHSVLLFVIMFLDGVARVSHINPFDVCRKRERGARLEGSVERAELYKTISTFFIDDSSKDEEFETNHKKPICSKNNKHVPLSEILPLINKAKKNEEFAAINETPPNDLLEDNDLTGDEDMTQLVLDENELVNEFLEN